MNFCLHHRHHHHYVSPSAQRHRHCILRETYNGYYGVSFGHHCFERRSHSPVKSYGQKLEQEYCFLRVLLLIFRTILFLFCYFYSVLLMLQRWHCDRSNIITRQLLILATRAVTIKNVNFLAYLFDCLVCYNAIISCQYH